MNRAKVWFFVHIEKGANQTARAFPHFNYLLLAPVAGGTTVGGIATCCVRRLHRSCKAERDHCHQHHCPDLLHGFSPWKNEMWFLSTVGNAIGGPPGQTSGSDF
jgi:hypothetical protein